MEHFDDYFKKILPIILKCRRHYFVKLWDYDDWLQEGGMVLFDLMSQCPKVLEDEAMLYVYFKTRFSSHVKDTIRLQQSIKRQFNRMPYEDISELSHCISGSGLGLADYVVYRESVKRAEAYFGAEGREKMVKVIRGERFEGKKAFLKELKPFFEP